MDKKIKVRHSGSAIMARLILLLGSLSYLMLLAVINGSLGFICAMGVTIFGSLGVAKALGEPIAIGYNLIFALTVGCGVLRGILRYFEQYSNHYIAFRLLAVLRDRIFGALRQLCPAKLEDKKKGSIIAMITADIETLEVFYAHTISPICIALVVSTTVFLFVGFFSSWFLALVALGGYLLIGIAIPLFWSGRLAASGVKYRSEFSSFNAYLLDSIKGIQDILLHGASLKRAQEVEQKSIELLEETKKMRHKITCAGAFTELLVSLVILLTSIIGIVLLQFELLTLGRMIVGIVTIFGSFGPVIAISALPGNLAQTLASGDRILDLLSESPAVMPIKNGQMLDYHRLETRDLTFSYSGDVPVLQDISLAIARGEIVGIIGKSGSGKSTFLKLLMRFWSKQQGAIEYDGVDIDQVDSASLFEEVTMVSQSTYLFDESLEDNLRIAKPEASLEEIRKACQSASIDDLIMSLPEGYKTRAGALGDHLSAGEKQRIGLARAFLRGSRLILLDEPTSNVDSINEGIILKSLAEHKHKKSIILVSHRESTMAIADRIYRMEEGRMVEVKS